MELGPKIHTTYGFRSPKSIMALQLDHLGKVQEQEYGSDQNSESGSPYTLYEGLEFGTGPWLTSLRYV